MKINVAIDTSELKHGDLDILRSLADFLKEKGNAAEISDAPATGTIITQDAQEVQDTNVHDAHETHKQYRWQVLPFEKSLSLDEKIGKILSDLGLKIGSEGKNKNSRNRSAKVISCYETVKKYFQLLGPERFKFAIKAIRDAWPKYYNGGQWNQLIVKDVCCFTYEYWDCGLDADKLSASLSKSATSERKYTPAEFVKTIKNNKIAGLSTRERYNTYIKIKENKLTDKDRGR